ncbi:adrenodoxin [Centruroides vittatus]|uniref:adrenodoxin n=1 Tax=Centruroides vittatus TaxID=120091 RepID=UPI00350EB9C9
MTFNLLGRECFRLTNFYARRCTSLCPQSVALNKLFCGKSCDRSKLPNGQRTFCESAPKLKKSSVTVTYIKANGERITATGKEGDNLLDIVVNNDIDLEGYGACEGTLSCSTCHLIFKQSDYDRLEEEPTDEELDMLDLAFGRSPTSRLGCQVCVTKELDGLEVNVPAGVLDARDSST